MGRDTVIVSALLALVVSCARTQQIPLTMPAEIKPSEIPLVERLRRIELGNDPEMEALAQAVRSDASARVREVIAVWRGPDRELAAKAKLLLGRINELALPLLLEVAGTNPPADDAWLLRTSAAAAEALHQKVAVRLNQLLQDKRAIPPAEVHGLKEEETPPPRRICDEAYLLARRLLNPNESVQAYNDHANQFLNLPVKEKSAQILSTRRSRSWRKWLVEEPQ